ncbi:F0F1 ATP synthase subunit epsilon [Jannaschia pohangensis]|uniref:ATP synthase epsilon chain n=1 Tax=Jannaschia pohangensis TaxID=390807 RepID=A0A1I3QM24_9RHOB|nr:F0F1 ATP synthase subunit epsilon [Jannaschia pohangensis]SFJ34256.1 ATP synthase F1 subcomplex epsilon subunit [Jannaschia pohangensis]
MQFELVSPERKLASEEVDAVRIPGADGDLTAMADHAPTITSLRPGILTIEMSGGERNFAVTGGFAEIGAGVTVLAERALPVADVTQEVFSGWVAEARKASDEAVDDVADAAAKLLADMVAMGDTIGLSA